MKLLASLAGLVALIATAGLPLAGASEADGSRPLFNGKDLTGWVNVNCAPNTFFVRGNDGVIKLSVNGYEVSGVSKCAPRKGYLALESEGAECHFKNLKIKELPSTNPTPAETADVDQGFRSLFDGLTLNGWDYWTPPGYASDHKWKAG